MTHYQAAHERAIIVNHDSKGRVLLTGRDRIEFINRMSTNKLANLGVGFAMPTILTTPIGRIIDLLVVLNDGDQAIAITGEGRGDSIRAYFQRNIFFNDQVKQANLAPQLGLLGVYGPQAVEILKVHFPAIESLALYQFIKVGDDILLRVPPLGGEGFWLLATPERLQEYHAALLANGASEADQATYELLQIEAGYPLPAHELTDEYIPLEAGLWEAVSFSKGCYTGQEIIARMESRNQLAKMLMRLQSEVPVEVGASLLADGAKVGTLSSIMPLPDGGYLGLGYIKTAYAQAQQLLNTDAGQTVLLLGIAGTQARHSAE